MKKGMINAITLALTLINLVLTIVMVFVFVPAINKTSNLVDKICTIIDLNVAEQDAGKVDLTKLENVTVMFGEDTENTVSLKVDKDGDYARVSVVLSVDTTHVDYATKASAINTSMGLIASKTIDVVSGYTYSSANKEAMEKEVLRELQELFDSEFIYSVSFNQFVLQ